jgi:hypothetical protein
MIDEAGKLLRYVFRVFKPKRDGGSFQLGLTAEIFNKQRVHLPEFGLGGFDANLIEGLLESMGGLY